MTLFSYYTQGWTLLMINTVVRFWLHMMIIIKLSLLLYYISTVVADLKPVRGSVQVGKIKMSPIGGG